MVTSGVASFSTNEGRAEASRCSSSPCAASGLDRGAQRIERIVVNLAARHDWHRVVQQFDQAAQDGSSPDREVQEMKLCREKCVDELRNDVSSYR